MNRNCLEIPGVEPVMGRNKTAGGAGFHRRAGRAEDPIEDIVD